MNGSEFNFGKRVRSAGCCLAAILAALVVEPARGDDDARANDRAERIESTAAPMPPSSASAQPAADERFLPSTARFAAGATLELKAEASVRGREVKLNQICRWSNADASFFAPLADLTIARFESDRAFESVSLQEIRRTLNDSGVNLGVLRFAGTTACTVSRVDVKYDESTALQQWIDAREGKLAATPPAALPTTQPILAAATVAGAPGRKQEADAPAVRTLRDLIVADASVRLGVPAEALQINFNPADDKLLELAEPQFKFNLEARRVFALGDVSWDVLIVTDAGNHKASVRAVARAWQNQVVLLRPVAYRQIIRAEDVSEKRVLSDRLPDEPLLTIGQCVGQEASRELRPGTVLTAPMVSPQDLAKPGQFVTVTLASGNIRVKTVARAMESGTFGQTVKVKNEATREVYEVVLTGPQEGTITPVRQDKAPASEK